MSSPVDSAFGSVISHSQSQRSFKQSHPSSHITMGESSKKLKGKLCETLKGGYGGRFSQLPEEVVLDIFSRLSFKDLRRCRCVRKSWYKSIPSPCFTKLHHEKSTSRGTYFVSYILQEFNVSDPSVPYDLYLLEFAYSTESREHEFNITPLRTMLDGMKRDYRIVGSCNGMLCLCETYRYDPVYVCNPIIGEYITLPAWNGLTDATIISGFGFDQKTGDHKVIRIACHKAMLIDGEIHRDLLAEVYTLGSKSWRKIGLVPFAPRGDRHGVCLNGVIHWIGEACHIVCFDLASEKFSLLRLPPVYNNGEIDDDDYVCYLEIRVTKGQLCLFDENKCRPAIWMMKRYGDEQSWMKEDIFAGLRSELKVVSRIIRRFRHTRDLFPYVVSFVSQIDPKEDASGEEGDCVKLGKWSKRLYPIESGPQPNAAAAAAAIGGAIGEDGGDGDGDGDSDEDPTIFITTDFDILMRLLSQ